MAHSPRWRQSPPDAGCHSVLHTVFTSPASRSQVVVATLGYRQHPASRGPGVDTLIGMGGVDTIAGGPGEDTAFGGPLNDTIAGGPDNDTLFGNFGSDTITGGPGDDLIDGDNPNPDPPPFPPGGNNDACSGGPGANVIQNCEITS